MRRTTGAAPSASSNMGNVKANRTTPGLSQHHRRYASFTDAAHDSGEQPRQRSPSPAIASMPSGYEALSEQTSAALSLGPLMGDEHHTHSENLSALYNPPQQQQSTETYRYAAADAEEEEEAAVATAGGIRHPSGIDLSRTPTTAALVAGARAAGAAQPSFFSLKLPKSVITRSGAEDVQEAGHSAVFERPIVHVGGARGSAFDPTNISGEHSSPGSPSRGSQEVGPLRPSNARGRNGLPSGTHIRRRPRSVTNRRVSDGLNATTTGVVLDHGDNDDGGTRMEVLLMPSVLEAASPTTTTTTTAPGQSTSGGTSTFSSTNLRSRAARICVSSDRGGRGGVGTGRAKDVLPPPSRNNSTSLPHRRRADPSPAPSRPPRARKGVGLAAPRIAHAGGFAVPGSPGLAAAGPTLSNQTLGSYSPAAFDLGRSRDGNARHGGPLALSTRSSHQHIPSPPLQQGGMLSSFTSTPRASSPLMESLDHRFGDRDNVVTSKAALGASRSGHSAGTKSPSAARQTSVARTLTPRASMPSLRGVEASASSSHLTGALAASQPQSHQSYAAHVALAEQYTQLCTEVGEVPNEMWVAGLTAVEKNSDKTTITNEAAAESRLSRSDPEMGSKGETREEPHANADIIASGPLSHGYQVTSHGEKRGRADSSSITPRTTTTTPRATTPVATRGGTTTTTGTDASTPAIAPKRSSSLSHVSTTGKWPSVRGSSQVQGGNASGTPRTRTTAAAASGRSGRAGLAAITTAATSATPTLITDADLYAVLVSRYCADHLSPYADNMKRIQAQRATLDGALRGFVDVAAPVVAEAAHPSPVPSASPRQVPNSGKMGPVAGVTPSPAASSRNSTPRKVSVTRGSGVGGGRRTLNAAAAKAAAMSDALQSVQRAVVSLLGTYGESTRLAYGAAAAARLTQPEEGLGSSMSQSCSRSGAFAQPYVAFATVGAAATATPKSSAAAPVCGPPSKNEEPEERSQTLAPLGLSLASDVSGRRGILPATTAITVTTTGGAALPPPLTQHPPIPVLPLSRSISEVTNVVSGSFNPPPIRFLDFVESQEGQIASQLSDVRARVQEALGSHGGEGTATDKNGAETMALASTTTIASCVQLEQSDMLDNPLFIPARVLQQLARLPRQSVDVPEANTVARTAVSDNASTSGKPSSKVTGSTPKSGKPAGKKSKPVKSTTHGNDCTVGGAGGISLSGRGRLTDRSSTESTPRPRMENSSYAPIFSVRRLTDDCTSASNAHGGRGIEDGAEAQTLSSASMHVRSVSSLSTDLLTGTEVFVLHSVPPPSGTTSGTGLTPRQDSAQFSSSDLGGSMQAAATGTPVSKAGSRTTKRATSVGAGKSSGGAGQRSRSSGASTRPGAGAAAAQEANRPPLTAPWLKPTPGSATGGGGGGAAVGTPSAAGSRSAAKKRNATLNASSTGGSAIATSITAAAQSFALAQQQRQLAAAWRLWTYLRHRVISSELFTSASELGSGALLSDGVSAGGLSQRVAPESAPASACAAAAVAYVDDAQQFSPRPSSASQTMSAASMAHIQVEAIAVASEREQEEERKTPPPTTPVGGEEATDDSRDLSPQMSTATDGQSLPLPQQHSPHSRGGIAPSRTEIYQEPSTVVPMHSGGGGNTSDDDDREEGHEDQQISAGDAGRVAESMAVLSGGLDVPRRLNMEESAMHLVPHTTSSERPVEAGSSDPSSVTSAPFTLSTTLAQNAFLPSPASPPCDEDTAVTGLFASLRTTQQLTARRIVQWWVRRHGLRTARAAADSAHVVTNAAQLEKVMHARIRDFLLWCVYRARLRRQMQAREAAKTAASSPSTSTDAVERRGNGVSPRATTIAGAVTRKTSGGKAGGTAATPAATSRERFQRAKEQRKSMIVSAPSTRGTGKDESINNGSPPRVPPLPLAASGISTFSLHDYEGDSSSFTVSALHRLLRAPPALLYATCMAALHYPTHPPMAYVDTTDYTNSKAAKGTEERERSEAPPLREASPGSDGGSACRSQSRRGYGNEESSSAASWSKWRRTGVWFVPFRQLRPYVCAAYAALIPPRQVPSAMVNSLDETANAAASSSSFSNGAACVTTMSLLSLEGTMSSANASYRGGSRQQTAPTALFIPATLRYTSIVDAHELQHATPVTKSFHRPFERWGMAYNFTARVFSAAAIYAWQLIFSHTPFDDAKQCELPTREERQARLERVQERNDMILDCYNVRSEREWMREATKDPSFVGQIYIPSAPNDDPVQEKECRENYDFVRNFLYQCFPNINRLSEIQDFLVGAGVYFVLKEVFHCSRDAPTSRRLLKYVPHLVVKDARDYLRLVTPSQSPLFAGADNVAGGEDSDCDLNNNNNSNGRSASPNHPLAAPDSLVTPRTIIDAGLETDEAHAEDQRRSSCGGGNMSTARTGGGCLNGLSGLQRATLHRYEQLRQLDQLTSALKSQTSSPSPNATPAVAAGDTAGEGNEKQKGGSSTAVARSPTTGPKVITVTDTTAGGIDEARRKDGALGAAQAAPASSSNISLASGAATTSLRRYLAHGAAAGTVTPLRATPTTTALSTAFNSPSTLRAIAATSALPHAKVDGSRGSAVSPPPPPPQVRETDVVLARVPQRLLRPTAAEAPFVKDFEDEVDKAVQHVISSVAGHGKNLSLGSAELLATLAPGGAVDVQDVLGIGYPDHFLVQLSERLTLALFGLDVALDSCEDLDAISS